jgi:hypothetical protein
MVRYSSNHLDTLLKHHLKLNDKTTELLNKFGPKYSALMYLLYHFTVSMFTIFISVACYFSFYMNVLLMVVLSSVCFWNGATYYMDYFSKRYESNLAKLDMVKQKVNEELGSPKKKSQ